MFALLLAGMIGFQPDDSMQQLEFLRSSYKANKETFAFGTFRFESTRGSSANLSDAESGIFSRAVKEEGLYVFDGKNARFDLIADPKDLAAATTRVGNRSSSYASAYRTLTDGKVTLVDYLTLNESDTAYNHRPVIHPGTTSFYNEQFFQFPLWIGDKNLRRRDLFHDLTAIKDGKASLVELKFDAELDGLKVCKLTYTYKDGKCTYWIDLKRGTVPVRILDHFNETNSDSLFIFDDLEHVPDAGWLPGRRLHILGQGEVVDRLVVTQVDTQNKPPASIFQLDFPESVQLLDRERMVLYRQGKTWSLLKLPSATSPGTIAIQKSPSIDPSELPGEIEPGSAWIMILPAALVLFLIVGSIVFLKKRNRRLRGGQGEYQSL